MQDVLCGGRQRSVGMRSQVRSQYALGDDDLDSEEMTSFELGYQTRLIDNLLIGV